MLSATTSPPIPTSQVSSNQAWDQLIRYLQQLPAVTLGKRWVTQHMEKPERESDYSVQLKLGPHQWQIVAQSLPESQLRQVRDKAQALKNYASLQQNAGKQSPQIYSVLLAPYLSEKSAEICRELGVGYVDLAGNCLLSFDLVHIERRTAENPFREKREMRSVFAPKAGRILRQMLTPPLRTWKVVELQKAAGVSLGYVSKISQALIDREWATKAAEGLRLRDAGQVLDAWATYYTPKPIIRERYYSPLHGSRLEEAIQAAFQELADNRLAENSSKNHVEPAQGDSNTDDMNHHAVLASFSAARYLAPFARQSTTYFYADEVGREALRRHLKLKNVAGAEADGANIVIAEPEEDDILHYALKPAPHIVTSGLIQTYLDLFASGERGREAAEHLRQELILPVWRQSDSNRATRVATTTHSAGRAA